MTKRELIDSIVAINQSASPSFLARFDDVQLDEYLAHLRILETPRLSGNAERYDKYFRNCPTIHAPRPLWRTDSAGVEEIAVDDPYYDELSEDVSQESADDFAEGIIEQPVGPAEREQLYADSADLEDLEDDEDDEDLEFAETDVPAEPVLAAVRRDSGVEDAGEESDETDEAIDGDETDTEVVVSATAKTDDAGPPFADQREGDLESWLY
ncbi:MAG: hypothetical protein WBF17_12950 [Phycisphaerae bacterium]